MTQLQKLDNPAPLTIAEVSQPSALIADDRIFERLTSVAKMMAQAKNAVPAFMRDNPGDCLAVCAQALSWGMNPFALANKVYIVHGKMGYEAQVVNAALMRIVKFTEPPTYEYFGDWDRILGKVEKKSSQQGGDYYVRGWTDKDEEGLGVIVRATLAGEATPRELTLKMSQCWPRNSTLWATDPKQQIAYLGLKRWDRLYTNALLGVYTPDELHEVRAEAEVQDAEVITEALNQQPAPDAPDNSMESAASPGSSQQGDQGGGVRPRPATTAAADSTPSNGPSEDDVFELLNNAQSIDDLNVAVSFAGAVSAENTAEFRKLATATRNRIVADQKKETKKK